MNSVPASHCWYAPANRRRRCSSRPWISVRLTSGHRPRHQASIHFGAAQAETRALIEASLPKLREMLAAQGFQLLDASVSQGFSRQSPDPRACRGPESTPIGESERRARHPRRQDSSTSTPDAGPFGAGVRFPSLCHQAIKGRLFVMPLTLRAWHARCTTVLYRTTGMRAWRTKTQLDDAAAEGGKNEGRQEGPDHHSRAGAAARWRRRGRVVHVRRQERQASRHVVEVLPPRYINLDPPFVVNFEADSMVRFLQVTVGIMTRDPATESCSRTTIRASATTAADPRQPELRERLHARRQGSAAHALPRSRARHRQGNGRRARRRSKRCISPRS